VRVLAVAVAACLALVLSPTVHAAESPLAGRLILLDPGHQLGNSNPRFAEQLAQSRFNGTTVKGCNTTGTATNAGYPESTFNWQVAQVLRRMLEAEGARVEMTRTSNSRDEWGPCVWDRGRFGARVGADLTVSIHADGAAASGHGVVRSMPAAPLARAAPSTRRRSLSEAALTVT